MTGGKKSGLLTVILFLAVSAMLFVFIFILSPQFLTDIQRQSQSSSQTQESSVTESATENEAILPGVTIGGVDFSGLTGDMALRAADDLARNLLRKVNVSIRVDGEDFNFSADALGLTTDVAAQVAQALAFGHAGTREERQKAADLAKTDSVDFPVRIIAVKDKILAALQPVKEKMAVAPADAAVRFMPWGYTADGTAFEPNVKKLADAYSAGKSFARPDLVRIAANDMPNGLRYQYWHTDRYIKNYIPADANISRFLYIDEQNGRSLDIEALSGQIIARIGNGDDSWLTVNSQIVEPAVKTSDLKNQTQLIASWTSSYRSHANVNRNWNVSRMSSFINGAIIEPGQQWSINQTAGYRNEKTALTIGWKEAAGILAGGYTQQVGGGVCQLGSTTYNAAIRAGLTIVSSTHHTIPSDYIPLGLDATLSSPSPDLILRNDRTTPFYLVSYVNPKDQNVTVEVYGQLPVDPVYGSVIYDFTSDNKGTRYGTPTTRIIYNATLAPDDTVIDAAHPVYAYAKPRLGTEIQVYKRIFALDGKELGAPAAYEKHKYPVINGVTYVFGPDPALMNPAA